MKRPAKPSARASAVRSLERAAEHVRHARRQLHRARSPHYRQRAEQLELAARCLRTLVWTEHQELQRRRP